jgi:hypothetical protein
VLPSLIILLLARSGSGLQSMGLQGTASPTYGGHASRPAAAMHIWLLFFVSQAG